MDFDFAVYVLNISRNMSFKASKATEIIRMFADRPMRAFAANDFL